MAYIIGISLALPICGAAAALLAWLVMARARAQRGRQSFGPG